MQLASLKFLLFLFSLFFFPFDCRATDVRCLLLPPPNISTYSYAVGRSRVVGCQRQILLLLLLLLPTCYRVPSGKSHGLFAFVGTDTSNKKNNATFFSFSFSFSFFFFPYCARFTNERTNERTDQR